jgi:hypothetical protein
MVPPVPDARSFRSIAADSNASLRTEVSVAGKRNFVGRDNGPKTAAKVQGRHCRDRARANNPANSGLFAENQEISVSTKGCDQMSPISSNNIVQKGLAFGRHWSGTVR